MKNSQEGISDSKIFDMTNSVGVTLNMMLGLPSILSGIYMCATHECKHKHTVEVTNKHTIAILNQTQLKTENTKVQKQNTDKQNTLT